jgi:hypothetical protein
MDQPIQAGDMVVIAKPSFCCNDSRNVGRIFTVKRVGGAPTNWCSGCFALVPPESVGAQLAEWRENYAVTGWIDILRLKRIPPLSELEGEKHKEELTA